MPFSLLVQGYPHHDMPVKHLQGHLLHAMFFHLLHQLNPQLADRLHQDNHYRPFTLSPFTVGSQFATLKGLHLPQHEVIPQETPMTFRLTFLDDALFPTFSQCFQRMTTPEVRISRTYFTLTSILTTQAEHRWSCFLSYPDLLRRASQTHHSITMHFLTPTLFGFGDVDLPLPVPKLVFQSYQRRFYEFCKMVFPPDFVEQVERYVTISQLKYLFTKRLLVKKVNLIGFTGTVSFDIHQRADPELVYQLNVLADFAMFCGTGKKTALGMGQTYRDTRQPHQKSRKTANIGTPPASGEIV